MPIYAYRCAACGHTKDVLRKLSDPPLTECPACGAAAFAKQVTAAGFQLKGSGWYATDFRNNGSGAAKATGNGKDSEPAKSESVTATSSTEGASATSSTEGASAPAAGCGGSCACH